MVAADAAAAGKAARGWLAPHDARIAGIALLAQPEEPYFPHLPGDPPGKSISVGDTSHGYLVHGVRLEESDALGILPAVRNREVRYGTEELVGLLGHAAQVLHAETGTRMWVGNLSHRGGGDIPFSVSHNSGRDADVAFAYLDGQGEPHD